MKTLIRPHWCACWFESSITRTYLYNFDPLKPHFYIEKLGCTEVYIIFFFISAQKRRLWVLARTASARQFLRVPRINVLSRNMKNIRIFIWIFFFGWLKSVFGGQIFNIFKKACFRNDWAHMSEGMFSHFEVQFCLDTCSSAIKSSITKKNVYSNILKILPPKKWKISDKKFWYSSCLRSKHRLWVLVRTASGRRF